MSTVAAGHGRKPAKVKITREDLLGTERRWRRFGEPTPAGGSLNEDGTPDYGLFGPGSVAWEVLLHPATISSSTPPRAWCRPRATTPSTRACATATPCPARRARAR